MLQQKQQDEQKKTVETKTMYVVALYLDSFLLMP